MDILDIALLSSHKDHPHYCAADFDSGAVFFGTVICTFFWLVAEMFSCKASLGLVTAINNWNVRLNGTRQEPS